MSVHAINWTSRRAAAWRLTDAVETPSLRASCERPEEQLAKCKRTIAKPDIGVADAAVSIRILGRCQRIIATLRFFGC